jgi:hypothetical protein
MERSEAEFRMDLPERLPPMVVIHPGISVVGDYDREVFFADGYYWARQDGGWYRSQDHRRGWARVEQRHVPGLISRAPPGQYRRYRGEDRREERRDDRRDGRRVDQP